MYHTKIFMKKLSLVFKIVLSLLLLMPILGVLGIFPEPTSEMYQTERSFAFIQSLYEAGYIMYINAIVFGLAIVFLWTRRELLASLVILPITINIVAFHLFLDGGLLLGGAMMGNILLLLNIFFIWKNKARFRVLLRKDSVAM